MEAKLRKDYYEFTDFDELERKIKAFKLKGNAPKKIELICHYISPESEEAFGAQNNRGDPCQEKNTQMNKVSDQNASKVVVEKEVEHFKNEKFKRDDLKRLPFLNKYLTSKGLVLEEENLSQSYSIRGGTPMTRKEAADFLQSMKVFKFFFYDNKKKNGTRTHGKKNPRKLEMTRIFYERVMSPLIKDFLGQYKQSVYDIYLDKYEEQLAFKTGLLIFCHESVDSLLLKKKFQSFFDKMISVSFEFEDNLKNSRFFDNFDATKYKNLAVMSRFQRGKTLNIMGKTEAWMDFLEEFEIELVNGLTSMILFDSLKSPRKGYKELFDELYDKGLLIERALFYKNSKRNLQVRLLPESIKEVMIEVIFNANIDDMKQKMIYQKIFGLIYLN